MSAILNAKYRTPFLIVITAFLLNTIDLTPEPGLENRARNRPENMVLSRTPHRIWTIRWITASGQLPVIPLVPYPVQRLYKSLTRTEPVALQPMRGVKG